MHIICGLKNDGKIKQSAEKMKLNFSFIMNEQASLTLDHALQNIVKS